MATPFPLVLNGLYPPYRRSPLNSVYSRGYRNDTANVADRRFFFTGCPTPNFARIFKTTVVLSSWAPGEVFRPDLLIVIAPSD